MTNFGELVCMPILHGSFPASFGALGNNWLALSALAILVSLFLLALTYMVAIIISHKQLTVWTRFELFQIFATAVVFILSIAAVAGMCTFDMSILSSHYKDATAEGGFMNMYTIADSYFTNLKNLGFVMFFYMNYMVGIFNTLARVQWNSSPLGVGSSESPLDSIGQINNVFFFIVSGFVISFMLILMQMKMVEYMAWATLFYLFPFGLFFRSFEPTRTFGGTLVGVAIVFFLFYPVMIVFNDYMLYFDLHDPAGTAHLMKSESDRLDALVKSNPQPIDQQKLNSALPEMGDPDAQAQLASGIVGTTLFLFKPVILYFIGAVVLPVIDFIVLVEIARALTRFLGEEIDLSNLTRLI